VTPGSVIFYKKFTFKDGEQSDKLLIILNSGGKKPYLVIKTTSRKKAGREAKEGCHSDKGYYFLPGKRDNFPIDTWILLYEFYEVSAADFLKAHFGGVAEIKGAPLKPETVRAIINCAKKGQDWAGHYDDLVK
jgi:hypothetical protein